VTRPHQLLVTGADVRAPRHSPSGSRTRTIDARMADVTPPTPRTRELHSNVLSSLGHDIVAGVFPPGHVLTLDGICTSRAVSRSVAREAVRVLESMGLVSSRRRVGITVLDRSRWNVFDPLLIRWRLDAGDRAAQLLSLAELRRGFEPVGAALAAERATAEQCSTLAQAVSDMVVHGRSGSLDAYLEADKTFHNTLLHSAGNEMIAALADLVAEVLAGRTHHGLMPRVPNPRAVDLHDEVARCIRSGDSAGAEAAMRAIIDESADALRDETRGSGR
jgi:DNA-binding FadR family transcriptional regulator